jgi:hypothetical protein
MQGGRRIDEGTPRGVFTLLDRGRLSSMTGTESERGCSGKASADGKFYDGTAGKPVVGQQGIETAS